MENINHITVLGTGTSTGVPTLGCSCAVCTSPLMQNKRFRSSILIETISKKNILIDATPDLRTQLLVNQIGDIDAAVITHEHADHTHGIDDLRPFCFHKKHPIPVFTSENCAEVLKIKFPYIFEREKVFKDKKILGGGIPKLDLFVVDQTQTICDLNFNFFKLPHGHTESLSFHTQDFAYIIDCNSIAADIIAKLASLKLKWLIIDCLRTAPHETHLHLDLSLSYAQKIAAQNTGLIHLSHEFDHFQLCQKLDALKLKTVRPLYDGQKIIF
jgi:phosphoribosyl 1,2-cyclic phosphate phosphodiesterase